MTDQPVFQSEPSSAASSTRPDAHEAIAAETYRKSRGFWRVVAFLALAGVVLALMGRFAWSEQPTGQHIARLVVDGTIATNPARLAAIAALGEDDSVAAVVVAINSPGGTTAGGEELYDALMRLREAKPVVSVIHELGASAAYMTAIGTDRIFAKRLSIVGSIGVLYQHVNAGKLMETIGVDLDKVASGPLKAEPDIDEPLDGAPRASIAALVDDSFQWFVDIVAERRGLTRPETLALADGRIVTGRVGVTTGLIDALGGEIEAQAWLEAERGVPKNLDIVTAFPPPEDGFDWIGTFLGSQARAALGLTGSGPITLDGLVSLWQVGETS